MADLTELASGLQFPEGPVAMADGSIVAEGSFASVAAHPAISPHLAGAPPC